MSLRCLRKSLRGSAFHCNQPRGESSICKQGNLSVLSVDSKLGSDFSGQPGSQMPGTDFQSKVTLVNSFQQSTIDSGNCPAGPHRLSQATLTKICATQMWLFCYLYAFLYQFSKSYHWECVYCLWDAGKPWGSSPGTRVPSLPTVPVPHWWQMYLREASTYVLCFS